MLYCMILIWLSNNYLFCAKQSEDLTVIKILLETQINKYHCYHHESFVSILTNEGMDISLCFHPYLNMIDEKIRARTDSTSTAYIQHLLNAFASLFWDIPHPCPKKKIPQKSHKQLYNVCLHPFSQFGLFMLCWTAALRLSQSSGHRHSVVLPSSLDRCIFAKCVWVWPANISADKTSIWKQC